MACQNRICKYNDAARRNGCKLFPGASWINCRGASSRLVVAGPASTEKKKTKGK